MVEVNLKRTDLVNLKEIGSGTNGTVYNYKNNLLLKLYHKEMGEIVESSNDDDIKIYEKGKIITPISTPSANIFKNNTQYYSQDGENERVKLHPRAAIIKAIERNDSVKLTKLPVGIANINGRFAGCVLEKQKGISVQKLTGLPLNYRKKIFLNILKAEKELLENNVYHIDLHNSPYVRHVVVNSDGSQVERGGHSHVYVNPLTLETRFIDLDGTSTIYTDYYSERLKKESLSTLNILMIEFLLQIDYENYKEDLFELEYELENKQIDKEFINKIINQQMGTDELNELCFKLKK